MTDTIPFDRMAQETRTLTPAVTGDPELGPFTLLPGTWANNLSAPFPRGWNLIALPIPQPGARPGDPPETGTHPSFRLLLNKYSEILKFNLKDKAVPNRGMTGAPPGTTVATQTVVTIDYEQSIKQELAEDFPPTDLTGAAGAAIHHEPGLFLAMSDPINPTNPQGPDIARLATIPHGDAALALGNSRIVEGGARIPTVNALPLGATQDLTNPYLAPYAHFRAPNEFDGVFDPTDPTALLTAVLTGVDITRTTVLEFDTTLPDAGIHNVPFVVSQANASEMKATFFIHELAETVNGRPKLLLQYAQIVQLDFLGRFDGGPGRIKWPHVSINTLEKVSDTPDMGYAALEQFGAGHTPSR